MGRTLEVYPVQLDLLMNLGDVGSQGDSVSSAQADIQLVHIRPPSIQVHSSHYFASINHQHPRRNSNGSLASSVSLPEESSRPLLLQHQANDMKRSKSNDAPVVPHCEVDVISPATPPSEHNNKPSNF